MGRAEAALPPEVCWAACSDIAHTVGGNLSCNGGLGWRIEDGNQYAKRGKQQPALPDSGQVEALVKGRPRGVQVPGCTRTVGRASRLAGGVIMVITSAGSAVAADGTGRDYAEHVRLGCASRKWASAEPTTRGPCTGGTPGGTQPTPAEAVTGAKPGSTSLADPERRSRGRTLLTTSVQAQPCPTGMRLTRPLMSVRSVRRPALSLRRFVRTGSGSHCGSHLGAQFSSRMPPFSTASRNVRLSARSNARTAACACGGPGCRSTSRAGAAGAGQSFMRPRASRSYSSCGWSSTCIAETTSSRSGGSWCVRRSSAVSRSRRRRARRHRRPRVG